MPWRRNCPLCTLPSQPSPLTVVVFSFSYAMSLHPCHVTANGLSSFVAGRGLLRQFFPFPSLKHDFVDRVCLQSPSYSLRGSIPKRMQLSLSEKSTNFKFDQIYT